MKKSAALLFIVLIFALTACSANSTEGSAEPTSTAAVSETAEPTETAVSEPTEETPAPTEQSTVLPAEQSENKETDAAQTTSTASSAAPYVASPKPPAATSKPAEPSPATSVPPSDPPTSTPTEPPVTSEPQPAFDINEWVQFAKDYGQQIGLIYDADTTGSWDTPIAAGTTLKYTERDIKGYLDGYVRNGVKYFSVWSEQRADGKFNIYIGYA